MKLIAGLRARLRRRLVDRLGVPEIGPALSRLRHQGFTPDLIFDVGAYHGDFARLCRGVWPLSRIVCFEPQAAALLVLERATVGDPLVSIFPTLLGSTEQESVELYLADTASSVLQEQVNKSHPVVSCSMTTIDSLLSKKLVARSPNFLKLDVQGYELEVLKGACNALEQTEVILAEVNLLDIHSGVPLLSELVAWLEDRAFISFDICGLTRRPLDAALWQADMIFVKKDHPLRLDKRWGSSG